MPTTIDRLTVIELVAKGAQLAEVLPRQEYDEEHLPDAIHFPLKTLTPEAAAILDRARPVIVYCWDALCDMSPRAAWRLERLGFDVYDYAAGKVDWTAAGLPTIKAEPPPRRAIDVVGRDVATCSPDTPAAALPTTSVLVVNNDSIVVGAVPSRDRAGLDQTAEDIMEPGPTTVRAHEPLEDLLARMKRRHVQEIIVTTPEGRLFGVVRQP